MDTEPIAKENYSSVLQAFYRALRRELHVLTRYPELLWQQMYNRLQWEGEHVAEVISEEKNVRFASSTTPWIHLRTPHRVSEALVRTLKGHTDGVNACVFSSDGVYIYSAGEDCTVRKWETSTGRLVFTLEGHPMGVKSCVVSTDGSKIASVSATGPIDFIAGNEGEIRIWDARDGHLLQKVGGKIGRLNACNFAPDGSFLVTASSDKILRKWDSATGQVVTTMTGHVSDVTGCAFSQDNNYIVSTSTDKSLRVWDADKGELLHILDGHVGVVNACAISPDGKTICSAGSDMLLYVWDIKSGEQVGRLSGHRKGITACSYSPDGRNIISAGYDKTLRLWDSDSGQCLNIIIGHTDQIKGCVFSPDGRYIASAGWDHNIYLWAAQTNPQVNQPQGHNDRVTGCLFSPEGRYIASAGWDRNINLWDAVNLNLLNTRENRSAKPFAFTFSSDGHYFASASKDNTVQIEEIESGKQLISLEGHDKEINGCVFSPDGRLLASASDDNTIRLWDATSGQLVHLLKGHTQGINACTFSPDGHILVSSGKDNNVCVWDAKTGQIIHTLGGHSREVVACIFSPDGETILSFNEYEIITWESNTGRRLQTMKPSNGIQTCTYSPDGNYIVAASSDPAIYVWLNTQDRVNKKLVGHAQWVAACGISPDGCFLFSIGWDETLLIWDFIAGEILARIPLLGSLKSLAIHPIYPRMVCGDEGGAVYLLELVGINYGPLIITARQTGKGLVGRCPACQQLHPIEQPQLGTELTCLTPGCGLRLKINPFIIGEIEQKDDVILGELVSAKEPEAQPLTGHNDRVTALAISADGKWGVSGSADQTVRVWDLNNRKQFHLLRDHDHAIDDVAIDREKMRIASINGKDTDARIDVWDLEQGALLRKLQGVYSTRATLSADGKLALVTNNKELRLWDVQANEELCLLRGSIGPITRLALTPDGRWAAFGSMEGHFHVWDLQEKMEIMHVACESSIQAVAITRDGSFALCADESGPIWAWSVPDREQRGVFQAHSSPVISMAFTTDELGLVSASADGMINVWDFFAMGLSSTVQGPRRLTVIAAGGSTILAGDTRGRIYIYPFEEPEFPERWPEEWKV